MKTAQVQSKIVRDLCWMFDTPALLSKPTLPLVDDVMLRDLLEKNDKRVLDWDNNSSEIEKYISKVPRAYKLGIYAESLLRYGLENFEGVSKVVSNVPVYREKQAIGEFDFLIRLDGSKRFFHWELAVKFYLCQLKDSASLLSAKPSDWVGPAGVDTLELKMLKMSERQLSLANVPEAMVLLREHGIENVESQVLSRGRLFYYWKLQHSSLRFSFISDNSLKGKWCPLDEFDEWAVTETNSVMYRVVPRLGWLSESDEYQAIDRTELRQLLIEHFQTQNEAVAVISTDIEKMHYFFTFPGFPKPIEIA